MASRILNFNHENDNTGVNVLHNLSRAIMPSHSHTHPYCNLLFVFSIHCESHQRITKGANSGIGLALTKQLVADYGCHVYLGSRDAVRGADAVDEVKKFSGKDDGVELLTIVSVLHCR